MRAKFVSADGLFGYRHISVLDPVITVAFSSVFMPHDLVELKGVEVVPVHQRQYRWMGFNENRVPVYQEFIQ